MMREVARALPFLLAGLAVVAAAVAAALLLLGSADGGGDPVGRLSPVQPALTSPGTTTRPELTQTATTPDDHGGSGRDHDGDD